MRRIEFRVWDTYKKHFVAFSVGGLRSDYTLNDLLDDNFNYKENRYKLQQFTGLLDSQGKEIYEGDIVRVGFGEHVGALGAVIFEYGSFMLTSKSGSNFMDTYRSCLYGEVVGNIFQNPELFK